MSFLESEKPKRRYNIPVLSGSAYVGQLYDGKTDQLLHDRYLWQHPIQTAKANVTNIFFETKLEESQLDRLNGIDIDASLSLSFMGGLISVCINSI